MVGDRPGKPGWAVHESNTLPCGIMFHRTKPVYTSESTKFQYPRRSIVIKTIESTDATKQDGMEFKGRKVSQPKQTSSTRLNRLYITCIPGRLGSLLPLLPLSASLTSNPTSPCLVNYTKSCFWQSLSIPLTPARHDLHAKISS